MGRNNSTALNNRDRVRVNYLVRGSNRRRNRVAHLARADASGARFVGTEDVAGAVTGFDGVLNGSFNRRRRVLQTKTVPQHKRADRICAMGFARFFPAMSGAVPPAGS